MLVRQLEEELRIRTLQNPSHEVRQQVEVMYSENDHLSREVAILRETVKVKRRKKKTEIWLMESTEIESSRYMWINNSPSTMSNAFLQELELRIETQKQTLQSRDESIKKLLEMLQNKGMGECL